MIFDYLLCVVFSAQLVKLQAERAMKRAQEEADRKRREEEEKKREEEEEERKQREELEGMLNREEPPPDHSKVTGLRRMISCMLDETDHQQ